LLVLVAGLLLAAGARVHAQPFGFAVLADPHIDGSTANTEALERCIEHILARKEAYRVKLVVVLGDIAWGRSSTGIPRLETARKTLDRLTRAGIEYVPIPGDNEIHAGEDAEFDRVFAPQYERLEQNLDDWHRMKPQPREGVFLQNFSFRVSACRFVCLDIVARGDPDRDAGLDRSPGGTLAWFENNLGLLGDAGPGSVLLFTHIGIFRTGFPQFDRHLLPESDLDTLTTLIKPHCTKVAAAYSGHIHQNLYLPRFDGLTFLYDVYATDECWDRKNPMEEADATLTVRFVLATPGPERVTYLQRIEDAAHPPGPAVTWPE
jgi:hypothetical protein